MAFEGNTVQHSEVFGIFTTTIREQLEDLIHIVQDLQMPYLKGFSKRPIANKLQEWLLDYINVDKVIANIAGDTKTEGRDAEFSNEDNPIRLWAPVQINAESWSTTGTNRVVQKAGRNDDHKYVKMKKAKILANQLEMAMHFGIGRFVEGAVNAANDGTNTRKMHGVLPWLFVTGMDRLARERGHATTITKLWPGDSDGSKAGGPKMDAVKYGSVVAGTNTTGGLSAQSAATFVDQNLTRHILEKDFLGAWSDRGGTVENAVITCGSALRRAISGFGFPASGSVPVNYREIPAELRGLYTSIDWIQTGVGRVYVGQDQYLNITEPFAVSYGLMRGVEDEEAVSLTITPSKTIVIMQRGYIHLMVLRGAHTEVLAKVGDADNATMRVEAGLRVMHPLALCGGSGWTEATAP